MTVASFTGLGLGGKAAQPQPVPLSRACHSEWNEVEWGISFTLSSPHCTPFYWGEVSKWQSTARQSIPYLIYWYAFFPETPTF